VVVGVAATMMAEISRVVVVVLVVIERTTRHLDLLQAPKFRAGVVQLNPL
jgi:hypothetical protein